MRPPVVHILALAVLFACGLPARAQGPRAEQGKVIARIIVEEGQVFLASKTGKPIVVPGQLSLREGDVLTTSANVKGRFELTGGKNLLLGRLRRYRVGREGIQEPAGEGGWRYLSQLSPELPRVGAGGLALPPLPGGDPAALAGGPGLIAKARVISGKAFHRPAGWPQEVPALPSLSLANGDELRLVEGALAQVQLVGGGWLFLAGPALAEITTGTVRLESGAAMAKALGERTVVLGPHRIFAGARVFSFSTAPGALTVNALTGILTIQSTGKPVYLAPGRRAELAAGMPPKILPIAIRPEIQLWEERFNPSGPRIPVPVKTAEDIVTEKIEKAAPPPDMQLKKKNPDGPGPERRSGPPDPRVEEPRPIAELPLRDRIKALDGARSRQFYVKKRDDREKAAELATFSEQVGGTDDPDEVSAFKLFRLSRQQRRARSDLNSFRQSRELSFEERVYRGRTSRDHQIRQERERLFGLPLFVETRRLLPFAEGNRGRLIAGADALTRDILVARSTGASDAQIAQLESRRAGLLEEADRQTDGIKELIRLSMEPYR